MVLPLVILLFMQTTINAQSDWIGKGERKRQKRNRKKNPRGRYNG